MPVELDRKREKDETNRTEWEVDVEDPSPDRMFDESTSDQRAANRAFETLASLFLTK